MSKVKFRTPSGSTIYPWLQPGRPDTAFDAEGKYKVQLKMDAKAAQSLVDEIKQVKLDAFGAKGECHMPFSTDEETGEIIFKLQSKYQPKYVDASGNPIPEDKVPSMFGGSTLKASGILDPYNKNGKGVSMRLGAIQIINPVSGSGGDAEFDAVEGYTVQNGDLDHGFEKVTSQETTEAHDY